MGISYKSLFSSCYANGPWNLVLQTLCDLVRILRIFSVSLCQSRQALHPLFEQSTRDLQRL